MQRDEFEKRRKTEDVPITDEEEEVLFITYRKKKIQCSEVERNWYGPNPPSYQEVLKIATRFNIDNSPYARYENGFLVWIGDRWSD